MANARLAALLRSNIKRTGGTTEYAPNMSACPLPRWHHRPHQITRLKAEVPLLAQPMPDREAAGIRSAHLARAMSFGSDQQDKSDCYTQIVGRARSNQSGVDPVRFGQVQPCPVVARPPARSDLDGQAGSQQSLVEWSR